MMTVIFIFDRPIEGITKPGRNVARMENVVDHHYDAITDTYSIYRVGKTVTEVPFEHGVQFVAVKRSGQ